MSHAVDLDALLRELEEADRNGEGEWSVQLHLAHSANQQSVESSSNSDGQYDTDMNGSGAISSAQYVQFIRELEHQLKSAQHSSSASCGSASSNLLQVASSSSSSTKQQQHQQQKQLFTLRKSLRSAYLEFIHTYFMDASSLDMESSLWKQTVHKQIEAFRTILKQSTPQPTSKKCAQQWKRYQQFHTLTRSFLKECMRLYEKLFFKHLAFTGWEPIPLPTKSKSIATTKVEHQQANVLSDSQESSASENHTSSQLHLPRLALRPLSSAAASSTSTSVVLLPYETRSLYLQSCHRCLLFRGDLERYDQLIQQDMETQRNKLKQIPALAALLFTPSPTNANRNINAAAASSDNVSSTAAFVPNWRRCERFYELAIVLLPELGNPWNQMAVLATYQDDPFLAVYRYIRAVACVNAFPTAEVNLKLLFGNSVSNHLYQEHSRSFSEIATAPLLTTVFPGVRVCGFEFTWMHVFHLLAQAHTDPEFTRTHLPCAVFSALAAYNKMLSDKSNASANERSKLALHILVSLLHFFHRYNTHTQLMKFEPHAHATSETGTPLHLRQQDSNSMYDEEVLTTKGTYSSTVSDTILGICVEFLSITITGIHTPKSPSIGVIRVFLLWLQRQKRAVGSIDKLQSTPKPILLAFLHNLASLANLCSAHSQLALSNPPKVDALEPDELMENEAIKGLNFMTVPTAVDRDSSAMDISAEDAIDSELNVADVSDASVRRCLQLVSGADFLVRSRIGLVKEELRVSAGQSPTAPAFRYRSLLDEEAPEESMAAEVLSPSNARKASSVPAPQIPPIPHPSLIASTSVSDRSVVPTKTVSSPARKQAPIGPAVSQSRAGGNGTPPHQGGSVGFQMARAFERASASLFSDSLTSPPIDRHIPGALQLPSSTINPSNDRAHHRPPPGFQPLPIDTIRWAQPPPASYPKERTK